MYKEVTSPWDTANNPPEPAQEFWGEVTIKAWWCMLVKGQGKLPYDEKVLNPETAQAYRKMTAIELYLLPLEECNLKFDVSRTMIAEFGEWKEVTLPSLRDLQIMDASTINGKFARIEMVSTGRKYTSSSGEEREATAIKFVKVFASREECLKDWESGPGKKGSNGNQPNANPTKPEATPPSAAPNGRETALKFAAVYVKNAARQGNKDLDQTRSILAPMLAGQKLIAQYFTVDSPEILDLITKECIPF